jgi:ketosteroid isomerase-like protein
MDAAAIERIKRSYELFNTTGRFEEDFFHPDIEWHNAPELPGAAVHRGRDAVLADLAAQGDAFEWRRADLIELLPGDDSLVVFLKLIAQGKSSGAPVSIDIANVWTVRDGKVMRIEAFLDREAALRAAGLATG